MFKYIIFPLYVIPISSQLQGTPGRPQRIRNPVSNPSMVSPSPDGRRRVSVELGPIPSTSNKRGKNKMIVQSSQDGFEDEDENEEDDENQEENKPSSDAPEFVKPPKKKQKRKKQKKTTTDEAVCSCFVSISFIFDIL